MTRSPWRSRRLTAQPDLLEIDGLGSESPTIRSHPPRVLGGPSGQVIRLGDSRTSTRPLDADNYLASLRNFELTGFARRPTVDGARSLMESLGSPQRKLNAIHITGTNGKGSTANVSAALLAAMGHRVGLYTSPHLHKVNERISISGEPISDAALATALDRVRRAANSRWIYPTWFEALTAAALLHFTEVDVDAAVIEVGMLGRWDATNVIDAPVAVVTNVELDHVELAGPTRELIALEKSGIIRAGATLVLGERDPALLPVFEQQQPNGNRSACP
jgi:dihydrofolate synthase/folylpolyglutamate synthase